ncbi:bile acid:sodium symporter family protein [Bacteroidota bacterium]
MLNFSPGALLGLNIILGFIMFGVALELKPKHFKEIIRNPKSTLVGLASQLIVLPIVTFILIWIIRPMPSIALGMILVAACPGGNISNFMSSMAKGNAALSVGLTAISTSLAIVMTPINFTLWGNLYVGTRSLMKTINLDPIDMFLNIILIVGIPVVLGILFAQKYPGITAKIVGPIKKLSILIFVGFVVIAFTNNYDHFLKYINLVIMLVFLHNASALSAGYAMGSVFKLSKMDRKSLAIETGIQNSGLGLILIFNFFNGLGGMAVVAAWWGIWHIISGLSIAWFWSRGSEKVYA